MIYEHCVGTINIKELSVKRNSPEEALKKYIEKKYSNTLNFDVLKELKKPEYRDELVSNNIIIAKQAISESTTREQFILQTINAIEELDKICNNMSKRLREWYGYYLPEIINKIEDNEIFVRMILEKDKKELIKDFKIHKSMGISEENIKKNDKETIINYAFILKRLFEEREILKNYLEELMTELCPNIYKTAGVIIGAKLIEKAGSLKKLSLMPSSTIQLLGAEKSLFRHLRNKNIRPPKHGIILNHPAVLDSKNKGKAARQLAAKISIAAKIDYFKVNGGK